MFVLTKLSSNALLPVISLETHKAKLVTVKVVSPHVNSSEKYLWGGTQCTAALSTALPAPQWRRHATALTAAEGASQQRG